MEQNQNKLDECGEPLVGEITVQLPQRMIDWIMGQVADYQLGPTPEFLDESAVIRETIHARMVAELEVTDAQWNRYRE